MARNHRSPTAGLLYEREAGSTELGECCCGRLMWAGNDAEAVVRQHFEAGVDYEIDINAVTLPWGENVIAALAVPTQALNVP